MCNCRVGVERTVFIHVNSQRTRNFVGRCLRVSQGEFQSIGNRAVLTVLNFHAYGVGVTAVVISNLFNFRTGCVDVLNGGTVINSVVPGVVVVTIAARGSHFYSVDWLVRAVSVNNGHC